MSRQNLKVRIHTYPYFDNVMVHEPGAEITLADPGAFSNNCMQWVEKPVPEGAPKIETPKFETPRIETPRIETPRIEASPSKVSQAKVAEHTRLAGNPDTKAAEPAKRRYSKRKVAKRPKVAKVKTFAPVLVPAPSAEEVATLIAEPLAEQVPVLVAKPLEEKAARPSEPSPFSEPTPLSQRGADTSAGAAAGEAEQSMSAIANVT